MDQRNQELEKIILSNTLNNNVFFNKIAPFLVEDYFIDPTAKLVVKKCIDYTNKYSKNPTPQIIKVMIEGDKELTTLARKNSIDLIEIITRDIPPSNDIQFLCDRMAGMAKDNALLQALSDCYDIWATSKDLERIRPIIDSALSIKFNKKVAIDLFDDLGGFFDDITSVDARITFPLKILNTITGGGIGRETLNILLAGTNVGKTMLLCWLAAAYIRMGYNVFYASSEINVLESRKRMFAGMLNLDLGMFSHTSGLSREDFMKHANPFINLRGRLKIEAWPSHTATAMDINRAITDVKILEPEWHPDIILVDHLSLFASYMMSKSVRGVNDHKYEMAVAEELRNLGVEFNAGVWSAAQFNRDGNKDQSGRATNIAGSFGIAYTADYIAGLVASADGQTMTYYQEKSRYSNKNEYPSIDLGLDYNKQKIFELDDGSAIEQRNVRNVKKSHSPEKEVIKKPVSVIKY